MTTRQGTTKRKPYRTVWEYIAWIVFVPIVAWCLWSISQNENFGWATVAEYLTVPVVLAGVWNTLQLTVISMLIGIVIGVVLAAMLRSRSTLIRAVATGYIWFFRGTPLLVQLIFWFNLAALFPFIGIGSFEIDANALITPFFAAILGLSLNEGAYMAEVVRGGLLSVDTGQREAAEALGMKPRPTLTHVILPQAMRAIIPPTGNQVIGMLKTTSLVSVLGAADLLHSVQIIYSRNYETIPLLIVACIWYLAMTTLLSIAQHFVEKRFSRGSSASRGKRSIKAPTQAIPLVATGAVVVAPDSRIGTEDKS